MPKDEEIFVMRDEERKRNIEVKQGESDKGIGNLIVITAKRAR